jgi:hypothetical protein
MGEIIAIVALTLIVAGLLVERYFYSLHMTEKLSEAMKAVMSKNVTDFIELTKPRAKTSESTPDSDEILLSEATEEQFLTAIKS